MISILSCKKNGLNQKMVRHMLISLGIAFLLYLIFSVVGKLYIYYRYDNNEAYDRYTNELNQELNVYIQQNQIKNDESGRREVSDWCKRHEDIVVLMNNQYNDKGETSSEVEVYIQSDFTFYSPFAANEWHLKTVDTPYSSVAYDYVLFDGTIGCTIIYILQSYIDYYNRVNQYICVGISIGIFIISMLIYMLRTNARIRRFQNDLDILSGGGESDMIEATHQDEIGAIANSALNMNRDLLESYQREEKLMKKLIRVQREIAHDIRTPLTILSGNLELLKNSNQEEREICIDKCMERIDQINELVERLLNSKDEVKSGTAANNFQQSETKEQSIPSELLTEQTMSNTVYSLGEYMEIFQTQLKRDKYEIDFNGDESLYDCFIAIPHFEMKRIFDNLYSNLAKYASREASIYIRVTQIDKEKIQITIENVIKEQNKKTSSFGLGEQICKDILLGNNGCFQGERIGDHYCVKVTAILFK